MENSWWWWWWFVFVVWLTDERHLALFPPGTIVRDPHHRESSTCCKQDLNLCRTWAQALLNEVFSFLASKVNRANSVLSKLRHFASREILRSVYFAVVQSHVNYVCIAWGLTRYLQNIYSPKESSKNNQFCTI